jgi:plasmid stabilization system protein ParE
MEMRVKWTKPAKARLRDIFNYYNLNASPTVAQKIVNKIVTTTRILSHNPSGGQLEYLLEERPERFRRLIAGNYKIIYWITDNEVWIATLFDTRQNPVKLREEIYALL